ASDTFALQQIHTDRPPHSASSAHTYRLLVFKDRSAQPAAPEPTTRHCFVCVAASAAEKRNYGELSPDRQQVFITCLTCPRR
ncbi:hypothetical protein, partial [Paraburkholderia youngii]|uniref:hypothetical protein n=1 Tax=Paraburkholderia youngii TaxID=2782701 RepID=UPI001C37A0A0